MPQGDIDWNPGNNDPDVGGVIEDKLRDAIRSAPRGSAREKELVRRMDYLWAGLGRMDYGEPLDNWWDGPRGLALNGTAGAANLTHGCFANDCDGASASS